MDNVTPEVIAQWMLGQLEDQKKLYQADAASAIAEKFGIEFIYTNDNGNPAIDKGVLRVFRKISGDTVVWDRWDFCWRQRTTADAPRRKQE